MEWTNTCLVLERIWAAQQYPIRFRCYIETSRKCEQYVNKRKSPHVRNDRVCLQSPCVLLVPNTAIPARAYGTEGQMESSWALLCPLRVSSAECMASEWPYKDKDAFEENWKPRWWRYILWNMRLVYPDIQLGASFGRNSIRTSKSSIRATENMLSEPAWNCSEAWAALYVFIPRMCLHLLIILSSQLHYTGEIGSTLNFTVLLAIFKRIAYKS